MPFQMFKIKPPMWVVYLMGGMLGYAVGWASGLIVSALVTVAVFRATTYIIEKVEEVTGKEDEEANGDEDDNGEDGEGTSFVDPNGGGDDFDRLWDVARTGPAPSLARGPQRGATTRAPSTSQKSAETSPLSVGFVAVLEAPGVPIPTKRNGTQRGHQVRRRDL